jgi:protoporphyrinogen oxidase
MILVVGGGLSGLSAAYQLEKEGQKYLLIEKENTAGGLCRSFQVRGYTFDYSGHLLCVKDEGVLEWIQDLLHGQMSSFERRASIYVQGSWVPYPFQANLGFLPQELMEECLADFLKQAARRNAPTATYEEDLGLWLVTTFGEAICEHFFIPYNEKLFGRPLKELVPQGIEWSIPRPSVEDVVNGALGAKNERLGYNATFHYPKNGGIEEIPKAIASRLKSARFGCQMKKVLLEEKKAVLESGEELKYDAMISTIPLPELLGLLDPSPPWARRGVEALKWVSVWVLNLGVRRQGISDQHWVYFPEKEFPFFRVGCYSAFGPHLAPAGCSSLYVEIPGHTVRQMGEENCTRKTLHGLVRCGILHSAREVEVVFSLVIPVAYVIHDRERLELLPKISDHLREWGIHCAGRYGSWGYGTMEDAIIQGKEAASRLLG